MEIGQRIECVFGIVLRIAKFGLGRGHVAQMGIEPREGRAGQRLLAGLLARVLRVLGAGPVCPCTFSILSRSGPYNFKYYLELGSHILNIIWELVLYISFI